MLHTAFTVNSLDDLIYMIYEVNMAYRQSLTVRADWSQLTQEAREQIMDGALAYHALKTEHPDFSHWVRVSKALQRLRNEAVELAGVGDHNNPVQHPSYRVAFKSLIEDERARDLKEINQTTRDHCFWLADNLDEVELWFVEEVRVSARLKLNHPTTIWRRHPLGRPLVQADKAAAGEGKKHLDAERRKQTTAVAINAATNRLHGTIDNIETMAGGASALSRAFDISDPAIAADTFRSVYADHSAAQLDRFAEALHSRGSGTIAPQAIAQERASEQRQAGEQQQRDTGRKPPTNKRERLKAPVADGIAWLDWFCDKYGIAADRKADCYLDMQDYFGAPEHRPVKLAEDEPPERPDTFERIKALNDFSASAEGEDEDDPEAQARYAVLVAMREVMRQNSRRVWFDENWFAEQRLGITDLTIPTMEREGYLVRHATKRQWTPAHS